LPVPVASGWNPTNKEETNMNTVNLIGRLTRDPELRQTNGGTPVCTLRLAVPRRRRNGEDQAPVYVDVVSFSAQAEAVAAHVTQGRQVAVTGRLEYREWKGQDGSAHSKHEVIAEQVLFLGTKPAATPSTEPAYEDEEPF